MIKMIPRSNKVKTLFSLKKPIEIWFEITGNPEVLRKYNNNMPDYIDVLFREPDTKRKGILYHDYGDANTLRIGYDDTETTAIEVLEYFKSLGL